MGKTIRAKAKGMAAMGVLLSCLFVLFSPLRAAAAPPANNEVRMQVNQVFTNHTGGTPNDTFEYVLEPDGDFPMPADAPGGKFTIKGTAGKTLTIAYGKQGYHSYTLRQVIPNAGARPGYTLDTVTYKVEVLVKADAGGLAAHIAVTNEATGGKVSDDILFTNSYRAGSTGLMPFPWVIKTVTGGPPAPAPFRFIMRGYPEGAAPMPTGSSGNEKSLTMMGAGVTDFGAVDYTMAGVYHYTVVEDSSSPLEGYVYDRTVYTLTVTVTDAGDGTLDVTGHEVWSSVGGYVGAAFRFTNNYTPSGGSSSSSNPPPPSSSSSSSSSRPPVSSSSTPGSSSSSPGPTPPPPSSSPDVPREGGTLVESEPDVSSSGAGSVVVSSAPGIDVLGTRVPLFGGPDMDTWALLNLILCLLGAALALLTLLRAWVNNKNRRAEEAAEAEDDADMDVEADDDAEQEATKRRRVRFAGLIVTILAGIMGVVVFLVTEDITLQMALMDMWTVVNAGILAIEIIGAVLVFRKVAGQEEEVAEEVGEG